MAMRELRALDRYRSKYNYLAGLTRRGWAYEHVRRNEYFRRYAYANQEGVVREQV